MAIYRYISFLCEKIFIRKLFYFIVLLKMCTGFASHYNIPGIPGYFIVPGISITFRSCQTSAMGHKRNNLSIFFMYLIDQLFGAHMVNTRIKSHFANK